LDHVFRAISDLTRRRLLDEIRVREGATLSELCAGFPQLSRFAVMKHLRILASAGLVVVRKDGRAKRHSLNPMPLRRIHEQWLSRFLE
jgi:DNA-binding transcriptional ArsR family regulator